MIDEIEVDLEGSRAVRHGDVVNPRGVT